MLLMTMCVCIYCTNPFQCNPPPPTTSPTQSPLQLQSTAWSSWLGMAGIAVWCTITILLSLAALVQGRAFAWPLLPDVAKLGSGWLQVGNELAAIIPIIGTAYTCQMTMHFVMKGARRGVRMTVVMCQGTMLMCQGAMVMHGTSLYKR